MKDTELEQLYARLEKPIYNVVFRWVWRPDEAQDIVQEAFVRMWRMRDRIEATTARALAFKIALNLAASRRRRDKLWGWLPLDAAKRLATRRSAEADVETSERRNRLRTAILELPESLRRVVLLCEFSEMSYDEIGKLMGIPAGTVGSRRHRALRLLRKALAESPARGDVGERTARSVRAAGAASGRAGSAPREDR